MEFNDRQNIYNCSYMYLDVSYFASNSDATAFDENKGIEEATQMKKYFDIPLSLF